MRCFPRASTLVPVCVALAAISLVVHPATFQAADLGQSLRSAFEDSQSESAKDDSDAARDEPAKPKTEATDDKSKQSKAAEAKPEKEKADDSKAAASDEEPAKPKPKPKYPPFAEVTKDTQKIEGLITLYRKDDTLLAELGPEDMNHDFIVLISIARGIGQTPILGGMSWGFGDDWVWQFRKVDDSIHLVRRNVRFTADKGSPDGERRQLAYTDSVLFSLPIVTTSPDGGYVVDLTPVFMSDLPQISHRAARLLVLASRNRRGPRSRASPNNIELEVAATYASGGTSDIDSVPDSRGATINVHYSISELPQTVYQPRLADDRVGYFLDGASRTSRRRTTTTASSATSIAGICKRPIPRPSSRRPKKPIIFWLEKTIPFNYRKPIRDGILEWNKAFEKAGFANAIEVRQQPDNADWDPEDINYNTFRWITAGAGFAMGPVARESEDRPDSRCRHHLRRRLPAVLEAGIRDVHARKRRRHDRRRR